MKKEEIGNILNSHKLWLEKKGGECADLSGADLSGADLSCADLSGADLSGADLRYAKLSDAKLNGADLIGADLSGANLIGADLSGAELSGANLSGANLIGAKLSGANLSDANLRYANLNDAKLIGADLRYADLSGANLNDAKLIGADLSGANLCGADLIGSDLSGVKFNPKTAFFAINCPEKGSFVGFKKIKDKIVELEIPEEARRASATTRKCRCEYAKVLSITNLDGSDAEVETIVNTKYAGTVYTVGEMVYPDKWDEIRWNECSHGIHFFITREEAVNF